MQSSRDEDYVSLFVLFYECVRHPLLFVACRYMYRFSVISLCVHAFYACVHVCGGEGLPPS